MIRVAAVIMCACVLVETAFGNPGELDSTFGQNGIARITLPATTVINAVTTQPDGKIVAVGNYSTSSATSYLSDFIVVRLNSDGTPDLSFDGDGIKTFGFGTGNSTGSEVAYAVVITPDNKILIAGVTYRLSATVFGEGVLSRLNADGSLDTTFGVGGVSYLSHPTGTWIGAIVPLPDGKYLLGGNTDNTQGLGDLIVFRIFANGAIDSTFGTSGRTVLDFDQFGDDFSGLAVAPDGRIVIAGTSSKSSNKGMSVARLTSSGQLDTSVPPGKFSFNVGYRDSINDISLQSDGKLLLASHMDTGQFRGLGMIVRLNSDGTRDTAFGSNGRIVRTTSASALTTDSNGHIYFVGEPLNDMSEPTPGRTTVQALDTDGSALANFGRLGRTGIDAGSGSQPSSITSFAINRLADGRLLVFSQGASELVVTRLLASGGHAGVISIFPALSSGQTSVSETAGSVNFSVIRTGGSTGPVTVNYAASSSTATAGVDFAPTTGTLSWADGEVTTKTITLPLLDDNDYEPSAEFVSITLSAPTGGAKIGTAVGSVAVTSDEQQSTIQIPFGSQVLANAASVQIPVQRTGDLRIRSTVDFTTRAINAVAGTDYQAVSGSLVWESGEIGDKYITVPILDDSANTNYSKRFAVDLSNPNTGTTLNYPSSVETEIRPYQNGGGLLFDKFVTVVSESSGTITLTVRPTSIMNSALTVNIVATPYSSRGATAGVDFATPNQTLSWAQNDTTPRTITFTILDDALAEGTEVVDVQLSNAQGNWATARVVILDDDPITATSQIQLNTSTLTVVEGRSSAILSVTRTGNLTFPASVQWRVVNGTAGNADLVVAANPPTLYWGAGDGAAKTITVPVVLDLTVEPDETFTVQLFNPKGSASLGTTSETLVTITENMPGANPTVQFAQSTFTVSEDAEYIDLPLIHSAGSVSSAYFYTLAPLSGTADFESEFTLIPEAQYVGFFGTPPNGPYVRLYLNGDSKVEGDETFSVLLLGRPNEPAIGQTKTATITLVSNDAIQVPVEISVAPTSVSVAESAGTLSITVNRTGSTTNPVSVNYQTIAGTAAAGSDFVPASGTLTWAIGDSAPKTIAISLINDSLVESGEEFTLQLSSPTNATVTAGTVTISIADDDNATPGSGGNPVSGNNGSSASSSGGSGGGGAFDLSFLISLFVLFSAHAIRRKRQLVSSDAL